MPQDGDQKFKEFLDKNSEDNVPLFLIYTLREKYKAINEQFKIILDSYCNLSKEADPGITEVRNSLGGHIKKLMDASEETLIQFDYMVADTLGATDEEDENEDDIPLYGDETEPDV